MLDETLLSTLDTLLARSPLAIVTWDRHRRISFWSSRAAGMFGYSSKDALGKTVEQLGFVAPEDLQTVIDLQHRVEEVAQARALINVTRNRRKDGSILICRWTTFSVQEDVDDYHVISYVEDITETRDAQNALAESEERFRSLFEHNPEVIAIFDQDGKIVDVNKAVERFGPVPREQIIGLHFSAFLDTNDVSRHRHFLERALAGETLNYNAGLHTLEGRPLEVAITTVPVYREGRVIGAFSIIRDETEAREAHREVQRKERALEDSEARLRSLFEHNPDGVVSVRVDGTVADINDAGLRLGSFPRDLVIGSHFQNFIHPDDVAAADEAFARALRGQPTSLALRSVTADRSIVELDATLIPQFALGDIVGVYCVVQDVSERRRAERHAQMQSERIRNLYFIAASADYQDIRLRASLELGCRALGLAVGAVVDASGDAPRIEAYYRNAALASVDDGVLLSLASQMTALPGTPIPVAFPTGVAMRLDVSGEPYGALVFAGDDGAVADVNSTDADLLGLIATLIAGAIERGRQRARLRAMAYYDGLTGLPNRTFLLDKLRDAIEVAQSRLGRVAILFLDLDRFKDVNDTLGHQRGDRLLQAAAARLLEHVGSAGTIARTGGDEFVVLLTEVQDADAVREIAEKIIAAMSEPFQLDEYEQFISTSIGIAIYPEDGRDDQNLIKNADIAMYRAKERGRNGYYFYNPTLEAPIHMRLSQEKLLRRALECNEFVVYYQPQLDLNTGEIAGVEALVRWEHPKSGLIEPSHFIPSAEFSGLIVPLGDWVLQTAAKQVRAWHDEIGTFRLAVNLSGRQFHARDLRRRVLAAVEAAGLDPSCLEVEITETVAMSDAAQTVGIVRDLKAAGIRTAVDDFGTGYSSLAYLRRFALDVLKIDGSFIVGVGHEAFDETIVRTVIGMAHSLGLEVVAEGVETRTQLDFLRQNGCEVIQGYVLAPPMPAADFEAFMVRRREAKAALG